MMMKHQDHIEKWKMTVTKGNRSNKGLCKIIWVKENKETRIRKYLKGSNITTLQQNGTNYLINNKQDEAPIADNNGYLVSVLVSQRDGLKRLSNRHLWCVFRFTFGRCHFFSLRKIRVRVGFSFMLFVCKSSSRVNYAFSLRNCK